MTILAVGCGTSKVWFLIQIEHDFCLVSRSSTLELDDSHILYSPIRKMTFLQNYWWLLLRTSLNIQHTVKLMGHNYYAAGSHCTFVTTFNGEGMIAFIANAIIIPLYEENWNCSTCGEKLDYTITMSCSAMPIFYSSRKVCFCLKVIVLILICAQVIWQWI